MRVELRCSRCGAGAAGGKFCGDCGAALERSCPLCASASPLDTRFCIECGASLDADTPAPPAMEASDTADPSIVGDEDQCAAALRAGWTAIERGDSAAALSFFTTAADLGHGSACTFVGLILQERGQASEAESWYLRGIEAGEPFFDISLTREAASSDLAESVWSSRGTSHPRKDGLENLTFWARTCKTPRTNEFWLRHRIARGEVSSCVELKLLLGDEGRLTPEFDEYLSNVAMLVRDDLPGGVGLAAEKLAEEAEAKGDLAAAERWLQRAAAAGSLHAQRKLNPAPQEAPPAPRAPQPTTNLLGASITRVFRSVYMDDTIKTAFRCTDGVNSDELIAFLNCNEKLRGGEDRNHWIVFSKEWVGIFRKGGNFQRDSVIALPKTQVASVGVGESSHYTATGMSGYRTEFASFTIEALDGRRFTRHVWMGTNEAEVNEMLPKVKRAIENLAKTGWRVVSGPAWSSQGGMRSSYGVGIWR